MLKLCKVSKDYKGQSVFKNLSFQVPKGKIVALRGPSGSGKSTLLRCIQNLESFSSGKISLTGRCGFMFQDFQLFPHMTVFENLCYAPCLNLKKKEKEKIHAKAVSLLETLALKEKKEAYPARLSGGQKQRVALARSLMTNPDLLLCDEPSSGLDAKSKNKVAFLLRSINAMGVTLLISSHDEDFITQLTNDFISL